MSPIRVALTSLSSTAKTSWAAEAHLPYLLSSQGKAHYEIVDAEGNEEFTINEENPWVKLWDALLGELPLVGLFSGYFFNPKYILKRMDGTEVARLSKEASFWGRRFKLEKLNDLGEGEGERMMLALMMMVLLERRRG